MAEEQTIKRALAYCQNCGEPVPKTAKVIRAEAQKVTDPQHPNKVRLGRVDLRVRCPNCRKRIVMFQQHYATYDAAVHVAGEANRIIREESNGEGINISEQQQRDGESHDTDVLRDVEGDHTGSEGNWIQPPDNQLPANSDPVESASEVSAG